MKLSRNGWTVTVMLAAISAACSEGSEPGLVGPDFALTIDNANSNDGSAYCADLLAGQTTDAGDVCVSVAGSNLTVTYSTSNGWELTEAHLFVGESQEDMPQTRKGNPKIGNFPHNSGDITGSTAHSISVDLTQWGFDASLTECDVRDLFVAAHAALRKDRGDGSYQTETGWGDGSPLVDRGSWATGFYVQIGCTGDDPKEGDTETAFAFGGNGFATCFIGADFDGDQSDDGFNRWGWSNGVLSEGDYTFDVYAGAGKCDLSKGTLVGTLTVSYTSGTATATFAMTGAYYMTETHLYIGSEPLARNVNGEFTVAPGQYPTIHGDLASVSSDTYTVTGLSGDVYVVAHATVGGF
jgi:hypothetical protein